MVWINFLLVFLPLHAATGEIPRFLTKHSSETLRYISMDGRIAYVTKKPGVLSLVTNFQNVDFLAEPNNNDFIVKASADKSRIAIESIPYAHEQMNLLKNHKIYVVDFGNVKTRELGLGRGAKLHLKDEWITFYDIQKKVLTVLNLVTQKKFEIILSKKPNPFFIPQVEMISSRGLIYTDINESGISALVTYDLVSGKSNVSYKSSQNATRLEICKRGDYLALGEFPYDGVQRGSKISTVNISDVMNLSATTNIYSTVEQDVGNIVCLPDAIYFVATFNYDRTLNHKTTELVRLDLKTNAVITKSRFKAVSQVIEMDGRVIIPFRGEFFVVEGKANLGEDILKSAPNKEELQIDI